MWIPYPSVECTKRPERRLPALPWGWGRIAAGALGLLAVGVVLSLLIRPPEIFQEIKEKKEISGDLDQKIQAALTEFDGLFQA